MMARFPAALRLRPHDRRMPAWPAPVAGALAFALYALTLAPGLTWAHNGADGGDFLAAALTNGVPHPSGYPTYLLLLRAAIALLPVEPARAGNWLSALCAAAAVGVLADLAMRVVARASEEAAPAARRWHVAAGVSAALTWAASQALWSQAVITEVYALNALAVAVVFWLLWRWRDAVEAGRRGHAWLAAAGLVLGLGLGAHLSLVLLLPAAGIWIWEGRRQAGRPLREDLLTAAAAAALGLAVYAYLPLAAATRPPVNWEDPVTPTGLWALVSGRIYQGMLFSVRPAFLLGRAAAWVGEVARQLGGPWSAVLALAGLWRLDQRQHGWWRVTVLTALLFSVYAITYNTPDSFVYLIPAWAVLACWLAVGFDWLRETLGRTRLRAGPAALGLLMTLLLCAAPAICVGRFWHENDLRRDTAAREFITHALADAAPDAVLLTAADEPTFALWYAVYGLRQRPDIAPVNANLYVFGWYRRTLAGLYPDLAAAMGDPNAAPRLDLFLKNAAAARPIYRDARLALRLPGLVEQPAGSLVRLVRE